MDLEAIRVKYDLSENGFLPSKPIPKLGPPFEEWELLVSELPITNRERTTRERVLQLPDLGSAWDDLFVLEEIKRAYVVTSLLGNAYVFNGDHPLDRMDSKVAVPLCLIAEKIGITPILTHATVDLFNWDLIDPEGEIVLDNLRSISKMTETDDESWFYLVMVEIEAHGGRIITDMLTINQHISEGEPMEKITERLRSIHKQIDVIYKVTGRMYERCDPYQFFDVLRPYIKGWKGNADLPNGLIYEGVSEERMKYEGGSAAQSSLIQCIDVFLGIEHLNPYLVGIRPHMPQLHREFITYLQENSTLKQWVESIDNPLLKGVESKDNPLLKGVESRDNPLLKGVESRDNFELSNMFEQCHRSLNRFRTIHLKIVRDYIVKIVQERSEAAGSKIDVNDIDGSGGSKMIPLLKEVKKETRWLPSY